MCVACKQAAEEQDGEEGEGVSTEAIKELLQHAPMAGVVRGSVV